MAMRVVSADWIVLPERELARGAIVLDDQGVVAHVGEIDAMRADTRFSSLPVESIRGVVLPALVNAHTHVELSALRGRVASGGGFAAWAPRLIAARAALDPDEETRGIAAGVRELRAFGTGFVGDVTNTLGAVIPLANAGIGGAAFHEVFSLDDGRARTRLVEMEAQCAAMKWPRGVRYAVAPHTLFTLGGAVVRELVQNARNRGEPTSLHLAEHEGERRALERGEGPVVEWLSAQLRIDASALPWPKMGPIALADELGALGPHVLVVHLTDATEAEIATVAARGACAVLCPRSNLWIEGRVPNVMAMRRAGLRLALGTDSLASNDSLDVLAEAKVLAERFPDVPPRALVSWATRGGAMALGLSQAGTIEVGKAPGLLAIEGDVSGDPCAWILADLSRPRRFVAQAGVS